MARMYKLSNIYVVAKLMLKENQGKLQLRRHICSAKLMLKETVVVVVLENYINMYALFIIYVAAHSK